MAGFGYDPPQKGKPKSGGNTAPKTPPISAQPPAPLNGPGASSGYDANGTLRSQIAGVSGYAPSNLGMLADYFKKFKPDTRMPQATVAQQYQAFMPPAPSHNTYRPDTASLPASSRGASAELPGRQVPILGRSGTILGYGWAAPGSAAYDREADLVGM